MQRGGRDVFFIDRERFGANPILLRSNDKNPEVPPPHTDTRVSIDISAHNTINVALTDITTDDEETLFAFTIVPSECLYLVHHNNWWQKIRTLSELVQYYSAESGLPAYMLICQIEQETKLEGVQLVYEPEEDESLLS